ncbi:MAG: efflux RND transporter periplasmic adaptor subunit [Pseudomonadota bacterium]
MNQTSPRPDIGALRRRSTAVKSGHDPELVPLPRFRWTTRVLVPFGILAAFVCLLLVTTYREFLPVVSVKVMPVVTKQFSGPATGTVAVQAAGWVEADPFTFYVTALTDGIVREILVLEGETVQADGVVARLVDDDARLALEKAGAEVEVLEASLASAEADLYAARTEWDNPVGRIQAVSVAEAELRQGVAGLNQTLAELEMERALLDRAKSDYERAVPLNGSGSISNAEYVKQRSLFNAQTAKVKALEEHRKVIEARIAKYEADLLAAREHIRLRTEDRHKLEKAKAAVLQARAALARAKIVREEARLRLDRMEVRAPSAGVVMKRLASPGSKVLIGADEKQSAQVLALYDPNRLQVRVDVPLAEAGKVGVGQAAQIIVEVLPDRTFTGAVTRVLHEANIQKNTLEVKVAIEKPEPILRPEMLARVRLLADVGKGAEERRQSVFGPAEAFRRQGGTVTAWLVRDRDGDYGTAYPQTVELGRQVEGWVEAVKGLQPGDLLIIHSPVELTAGKRVFGAGDS